MTKMDGTIFEVDAEVRAKTNELIKKEHLCLNI